MSLTDSVLRPVAAFVLAAVVANCNQGCLPGYTAISPAEAYAMEVSGCVAVRNTAVVKCAQEAEDMASYYSCKDEAEEKDRQCRAQVDRKYLGYNSQGGYPSEYNPPGR